MLLGIDFIATAEFQAQVILLHKGKLTNKQQFIKDTVPRNEVEPPLNRVSRISQQLEEEMPTEVINHMFNREDFAASSNHPSGWGKTPDYMYKARLTPALNASDDDDDPWGRSSAGERQMQDS